MTDRPEFDVGDRVRYVRGAFMSHNGGKSGDVKQVDSFNSLIWVQFDSNDAHHGWHHASCFDIEPHSKEDK
jgi:hypothetical protein